MSWGESRPWVVAAAGPSGWSTVAAALVAAGGNRVAAVVVGPAEAELLRSVATTYVAVPVASRADDVVRIATALVPSHDRVVVTAPGGLLAPLGGFTLADVAWVLRAPVVVAADPGASNDVRLTLEVLERRHVAASVVAVEPTDRLGELPVALAGEIPADAAERPDFAQRAREWLDPLLRGDDTDTDEDTDTDTGDDTAAADGAGDTDAAGTDAGDEPVREDGESGPEKAEPAPPPIRVFSGKRIAIALLILTIAALQVLYLITLFTDGTTTLEPESQPLHAYVAVESVTASSVRIGPSLVPAGCAASRLDAVPSTPNEATTARVNAAWTRIEAALAAKAPLVAASLRPGAAPEKVLVTQARMGMRFPADLTASLRRHDGAVARAGFTFPPFHRFIGIDEIYAEWLLACRFLGGRDEGNGWHRLFVPFAESVDGGSLVLDQRPGMGGRVGDYWPESGTRFEGQPASLTELLEAVATSLETGEPYAGRYRPVTMPDGTLDWAA